MKKQSATVILLVFLLIIIGAFTFLNPKPPEELPVIPSESVLNPAQSQSPSEQEASINPPDESESEESESQVNSSQQSSKAEDGIFTITLTIGSEIFSAQLYDNATTKAFIDRLPLTLSMGDMNQNEKYNYLDESLPTNSKNPGQIKSGDIMLFGSDCLVVFYKELSSGYSYTSLGRVNDANGFAKAVGSGSVTVIFERS